MRSRISLPIDIQAFTIMNGLPAAIADLPDEDVATTVWFHAPNLPSDCHGMNLCVDLDDIEVEVRFWSIPAEDNDPLFQATKNMTLAGDEHGRPFVPTRRLLDNRGRYPTTAVEVEFPRKLKGDLLNFPGKPVPQSERERLEIMGPDPLPEKMAALRAANRAIKASGIRDGKPLTADEVTAQYTTYWNRQSKTRIQSAVSLLTKPTAFREAAEDYYLGEAKDLIDSRLLVLKRKHPSNPADEPALFHLVLDAIDDVLVHQVQTRRWTEPFWDGSRMIVHDGSDVFVPRAPKGEVDIQPTLHVLLQMALQPFGVHVIRESHEGSGFLDFRFACTTPGGVPISVAAEFKLAHHKKIKAGISRQLPRYMNSIPCAHGVFILMWFKDSDLTIFRKPKSYDLQSAKDFLANLAAAPENPTHVLEARVLDCSIQPSASQL